jgi:hypothetical protein
VTGKQRKEMFDKVQLILYEMSGSKKVGVDA